MCKFGDFPCILIAVYEGPTEHESGSGPKSKSGHARLTGSFTQQVMDEKFTFWYL